MGVLSLRLGRWFDLAATKINQGFGAISIDTVHAHIHEGDHYYYIDYIELDAGEDLDIVLVTPSDCAIHEVISFQSSGEALISCYRDVIEDGSGSVISLRNSNANSLNLSCLDVRSNPLITDLGELLQRYSIGSGSTPGNSKPGSGARENENILKRSTKYLCRLSSRAINNKISFQLFWYEVED